MFIGKRRTLRVLIEILHWEHLLTYISVSKEAEYLFRQNKDIFFTNFKRL